MVNLLLGGSAPAVNLGDGAIHGGDGLLGGLLLLAHVDGVVDDLLLKGTGHLIQGDEVVLGVLLNAAFGAHRLIAGLAVGVDLDPNVLLAARDPLDGGGSSQGIIEGDLLVVGSGSSFSCEPSEQPGQKFSLQSTQCILASSSWQTVALDHSIEITGGTLK